MQTSASCPAFFITCCPPAGRDGSCRSSKTHCREGFSRALLCACRVGFQGQRDELLSKDAHGLHGQQDALLSACRQIHGTTGQRDKLLSAGALGLQGQQESFLATRIPDATLMPD